MCAFLIPVAAAVGAVVSAAGAVAQGVGAANQASDAASQARINAGKAAIAAEDAYSRGAVEVGRMRGQTSQVIGQQRAGYAASGVDVSTGSAADVQAATQRLSDVDAQTIRANAAREAWGYQSQRQDFLRSAQRSEDSIPFIVAGTGLKTAGTLINGAADTYSAGVKAGVWGK